MPPNKMEGTESNLEGYSHVSSAPKLPFMNMVFIQIECRKVDELRCFRQLV
jgi:hypothetical protein